MSNEEIKKMVPHRYPIWVMGFLLIILACIIASSYFFWPYVKVAGFYQTGKDYSGVGKYDQAVTYLKKARDLAPTSRAIKIQLATAYFGAGDDEQAMNSLINVSLKKREFEKLQRVMPAEYEKYFKLVKKEGDV